MFASFSTNSRSIKHSNDTDHKSNCKRNETNSLCNANSSGQCAYCCRMTARHTSRAKHKSYFKFTRNDKMDRYFDYLSKNNRSKSCHQREISKESSHSSSSFRYQAVIKLEWLSLKPIPSFGGKMFVVLQQMFAHL